jgi:hypothetical protein
MSKLLGTTAVFALLMALGGTVSAADSDERKQPQAQPPQSDQPAQTEVNDPAAGGAVASERYLEYLSSLKKCEPLKGKEKDDCIEEMRRKHGQM